MQRVLALGRRWSTVAFGITLLVVTVVYPFVEGSRTVVDALQLGPPAVLALLVVSLGLWAGRESGDVSVAVLRWSLAGSVGTLLVTSWIVVLRSFEGANS